MGTACDRVCVSVLRAFGEAMYLSRKERNLDYAMTLGVFLFFFIFGANVLACWLNANGGKLNEGGRRSLDTGYMHKVFRQRRTHVSGCVRQKKLNFFLRAFFR